MLRSVNDPVVTHNWTLEETKSLIQYYEKYPELWLLSSPNYKNREAKKAALNDISKVFGLDPAEINRKLHNLRTQFHNERRKLQRKRSAPGARRLYTSTWEYFMNLKFLLANDNSGESNSDMVRFSVDVDSTKNSTYSIGPTTRSFICLNPQPPPIIPNPNKQKCSTSLTPAPDKENDDISTFGGFVSSSLRNLRSESRRREMRRKILRIILEIEELDESDQQSICSGSLTPLSSPMWESAQEAMAKEMVDSIEVKVELDCPED